MAIKKNAELEINEQIRDKEVRVIGAEGEQLGVMSIQEAQQKAREAELDLIKIAATAQPPVVRIADYGKYRYELLRKEKEARKNQHTTELKEIRMTPNIDTNDLNTKLSAARKFLEKGNKVKIALRFRGREMSRMNQSKYILDEFGEKLSDIAVLDKAAKVAKLKLKTKRAAAKRFKLTGTGKLVRNKANKSHILTKKTTKRKRTLRKDTVVDHTNEKVMKKILPYL